jgi:hypothetical protein
MGFRNVDFGLRNVQHHSEIRNPPSEIAIAIFQQAF